jgi:hypothetical protein
MKLNPFHPERVVVHARVTGARGPWVGRQPRLAWLGRDPMTAAEREASLDRLCEQDEGYREDEADEYGDFEPFTAQELAEISEAAADELLAVEAASTGRRGPGQPGSARLFPGESSSPAAAFAPGMVFDVLPGCAQLADFEHNTPYEAGGRTCLCNAGPVSSCRCGCGIRPSIRAAAA